MKVKCFPFVHYQNWRLKVIQFVAYCGSAAEKSQAVFIKNGDDAQDARDVAEKFYDEQ